MGKIVITGGNGFLFKNWFDEFSYQYEDIVAPRSSEVNWVSGKGVDRLPYNPDVFIHSAAVYGGLPFITNNVERVIMENTAMNINVLNYIINAKPKKVITIGSACTYPGVIDSMLTEDMYGDGMMHPSVEHYGLSKYWMYTSVKALHNNWQHLIVANIYGTYDHTGFDKSHVVQALLEKYHEAKINDSEVQLLGTGVATRSLVHASDVCDVIDYFIKNPCTNQAVNVGHGDAVSIRELAEVIADEVGFEGETWWGTPDEDGALRKELDYTLLDSIYPDRQKTDLRDGIQGTYYYMCLD